MNINELQKVFEYELKRKLRQRCKTQNEEVRYLINSFKFYDYESSSIIDKNNWVKGVLKTGLSGFGMNDLLDVFDSYDLNNTGFINYQNFTNHLYYNEELSPIPKEYLEKNTELTTRQNNNRVKSPYIEFQPPGLYERSIDMLENEELNQRNSPNINQYQEIKNNNYIINNNNNNILKQNNIYTEINQKKSPNTPFITSSNIIKNINNSNNINNDSINNNKNNTLIKNYSPLYKEDSSYFKKLLLLLQTKINIENGMSYYTYAQKLKSYENQTDKTITLNSFYSSLRDFNISVRINDLTDFFNYLDKSNLNKVPSETILKEIRGNLSEKRKNLLIYIYSLIDKDKMGRVPINIIRSSYNCKLHPDVYIGFKQEEDIYKEFCYTFDMYCSLYNIHDYMTCEEFVDYYWGISASIIDDNYFEDILSGVWNKNININKNISSIINENLNINQKYNENYRKELLGNRIENNSNYYLNNRYVNNQNQNNYNYINYKNNSNLIKNKSQPNYDFSPYTPIPQENESNHDRVTPYYHPSKTPLDKGVKMFRSIRHNPITNEFIMSKDIPNNGYYESSQFKNINKNNDYNTEYKANYNMNNYENNYNNNINRNVNIRKPINELEQFKQIIMSRGPKGIFIFQKFLCLYDKGMAGELDYNKFNELLEMFNINMSKQNSDSIFEYLDKDKKGIIKYDDLIKELIGNINMNREFLIKKLYDNLNKDSNNNISINDLKQKFKAYNHPEVINRFKSEKEVFYDFLESIDIFKNYKNIIKGQNTEMLTYEDFLDFYKEISIGIRDDKFFEDLLINCWNINNEKNIYNIENKNELNLYENNNLRIRTANQILNNKRYNY